MLFSKFKLYIDNVRFLHYNYNVTLDSKLVISFIRVQINIIGTYMLLTTNCTIVLYSLLCKKWLAFLCKRSSELIRVC